MISKINNCRSSFLKIAVGITMLLFLLFAGSTGADPSPVLLKINGSEQTGGYISSCWKEENETYSICCDSFSINTAAEPLLTRSPFTAHLTLPLQEHPEELGFSVTQVTDDNESYETRNDFFRTWSVEGNAGNWNKLPLDREPDINLAISPGLYVLNVFAKGEEKGDVSYGFLVNVSDLEADVATQATQKASGFQFALAITILLGVYIAGRRR